MSPREFPRPIKKPPISAALVKGRRRYSIERDFENRLQYSRPEPAELSHGGVDTRSDVCSLPSPQSLSNATSIHAGFQRYNAASRKQQALVATSDLTTHYFRPRVSIGNGKLLQSHLNACPTLWIYSEFFISAESHIPRTAEPQNHRPSIIRWSISLM